MSIACADKLPPETGDTDKEGRRGWLRVVECLLKTFQQHHKTRLLTPHTENGGTERQKHKHKSETFIEQHSQAQFNHETIYANKQGEFVDQTPARMALLAQTQSKRSPGLRGDPQTITSTPMPEYVWRSRCQRYRSALARDHRLRSIAC